MEAKDIFLKLKDAFGDAVIELKEEALSDPSITVSTGKLFDICHTLRDKSEFDFDYMMSLSGMDYGENLGVVYHLYSIGKKHKLVLKVLAPKSNPEVPSVERIWKTADWHEREAYDLVGVKFTGHSNLIRILCPYDWEGHPLQKDYKEPEEYHGMKVPY